ncbi:MAG: hypothetical protein O2923_10740 [Verrucomicrobia bacterium]|nr:hypothetical protein [Verrucomicrobiota bacterium]MDA1085908.1 hypothetical protein [Verrucomicrobiota bacterium]
MAPPDGASRPKQKPTIRKASEEKTVELVASIGRSVSNMGLYGPDHAITRAGLAAAHDVLRGYLAGGRTISFRMIKNALAVDDELVSVVNPQVRSFVRQMNIVKLSNFSVTSGISDDEFSRLIELLLDDDQAQDAADRTDYFQERIVSGGFTHVDIKTVTNRETGATGTVSTAAEPADADEQAQNPQQPPAQADSSGSSTSVPAAAAWTAPRREGPRTSLGQVVAYLRGIDDDEPAGIDEEIYIASHAQGRLSQRLVKAAVLSQNSAVPDDGHSFGQFLVTGLKQTAGSLRRHPSFETQEGQRHTAKVLAELEAEVLERIKHLGSDTLREDAGRISTAFEHLSKDLTSEVLVSEYRRRRRSLTDTEKRISALIHSKGVDEAVVGRLRDDLADAGMTRDDWDRLSGQS